MLTILSEDDEHLKDFAEYMPYATPRPKPGAFRLSHPVFRLVSQS